ncbi:MAG: methyltransferase [Phycisphaera sp.]|nr:methyltransferase [Phycisphaera sp.]
MRVIAGTHRGRQLIGPADATTTRPITVRVKTSLFDRLDAAGRVEDAVVLDLFTGTGSIGIECLSRGAKHVTFVERDRDALKRLNENLTALRETDNAKVLPSDALSAALFPALGGRSFSLVFMDPPYVMMLDERQRQRVENQMSRLAGCCDDDALLVLRTPEHAEIRPVEAWREPEVFDYGSMAVSFYRK